MEESGMQSPTSWSYDTSGANLIEFMAGRMTFDGRKVTPDARKGLIRLILDADSVTHFQWICSSSGEVEEDEIVLPLEAVFEKVSQSKHRVYMLNFVDSARSKRFYYMQNPSPDTDAELCRSVNECLNKVPYQTHQLLPDGKDRDDTQITSADMEVDDAGHQSKEPTDLPGHVTTPRSEMNVISLQDMQQAMLGTGAGPAAAVAGPGAGATSQGLVSEEALRRVLLGLGSGSVQAGSQLLVDSPSLTLSSILKPEWLLPVLRQDGVHQQLAAFLPEDLRSLAAMEDLIESPQFRQQVDTFSQLLQSGQVDWSQFGIPSSPYGLGLVAFLYAIVDSVERTETPSASNQVAGPN